MPVKVSSKYPLEADVKEDQDIESGYASAASSEGSLPEIVFTKPHLQFLNRQLQFLEPQGELVRAPWRGGVLKMPELMGG
jgi:phosphoadenosine phosphosulfate reductase